MSDVLERGHASKLGERAGLEGDGDVLEQMRRRLGRKVVTNQAEVEQRLAVQVREEDIATRFRMPKPEKRWAIG